VRHLPILHLHLKGEYFDQIRDGVKTEEYRLASKWEDRLSGPFAEVRLYRGYPKSTDTEKILRRQFNGVRKIQIIHPQFGDKPVRVCAIDVSKPLFPHMIVTDQMDAGLLVVGKKVVKIVNIATDPTPLPSASPQMEEHNLGGEEDETDGMGVDDYARRWPYAVLPDKFFPKKAGDSKGG